MASGINATFRQVGIATGIAGLGAIFQHQIVDPHDRRSLGSRAATAREVLAAAHGQLAQTLSSGSIGRPQHSLGGDRARRRSSTPTASASSTPSRPSPPIAAAIALIGAVRAFALVRSRDFVGAGAPSEAAESEPVIDGRRLADPTASADADNPDTRAPAGAGSADRRGRSLRELTQVEHRPALFGTSRRFRQVAHSPTRRIVGGGLLGRPFRSLAPPTIGAGPRPAPPCGSVR